MNLGDGARWAIKSVQAMAVKFGERALLRRPLQRARTAQANINGVLIPHWLQVRMFATCAGD